MSEYKIDITEKIEGAKEAGVLVELIQDNDCRDSPLDEDSSATFWRFERDRVSDPNAGSEFEFGPADFAGWDEFRAAMEAALPGIVILPVYRYSHSGTTYRTTPFSCPWDSGQVGWVYATPELQKEWFGTNPYTVEQIEDNLRGAIEEYDKWQSGDVWGFVISRATTEDEDGDEVEGEELDACWGHIGEDWAVDAAKEAFTYLLPTLNEEAA